MRMGGSRQTVRLRLGHWLALAGVLAAIGGVVAWQSSEQCTAQARLVFSPPSEAPWMWTLAPGLYRVRVTGDGLNAECTFVMPEYPESCTGDRLGMALNAKGIVGLYLEDPPAHFTATVDHDGSKVLTQHLTFPPSAKRPCQLRELSLDLPDTVRRGRRSPPIAPVPSSAPSVSSPR